MESKVPAFFECHWEPTDISAVRALERGDASPDQQQRALAWFINHAAKTYDSTFIPGSPDASAFAEGRRFVGLQTVMLLKLNASAFTKEQTNAR